MKKTALLITPEVGKAYCLTNSTLRFLALPSSMELSATGLVSPKPAAVRREASIPCCWSQLQPICSSVCSESGHLGRVRRHFLLRLLHMKETRVHVVEKNVEREPLGHDRGSPCDWFQRFLKQYLFFKSSFSYAAFFFGTLAPFFRASDSPIAIACLRLFTFPPLPPLPDLSVPLFLRRMALATDLLALLLYLRPLDFFFLGIRPPDNLDFRLRREVVFSSQEGATVIADRCQGG